MDKPITGPEAWAEFIEMVRQMRHCQRRCQYNITPEKLKNREHWEKLVDDILSRYFDTQLKLFKNE